MQYLSCESTSQMMTPAPKWYLYMPLVGWLVGWVGWVLLVSRLFARSANNFLFDNFNRLELWCAPSTWDIHSWQYGYQVVSHLYLWFCWLVNTIQFEYHPFPETISCMCEWTGFDANVWTLQIRGANTKVRFHLLILFSCRELFSPVLQNNMFFHGFTNHTHTHMQFKLDAARSCFKSIKCI